MWDQRTPMFWKGREVHTMGDVLDALRALESPDEADVFIRMYRTVTEWADENVQYARRCFDADEATRVAALFERVTR